MMNNIYIYIESWTEWDLNPRPLNSVQMLYASIYIEKKHI